MSILSRFISTATKIEEARNFRVKQKATRKLERIVAGYPTNIDRVSLLAASGKQSVSNSYSKLKDRLFFKKTNTVKDQVEEAVSKIVNIVSENVQEANVLSNS